MGLKLRGPSTPKKGYFGSKFDFPIFWYFWGLKAVENLVQPKKSRKNEKNLVLLGGENPLFFYIFLEIIFFWVLGPKIKNLLADFYKLWLLWKRKPMARRSSDYIFKFGHEIIVKRVWMDMSRNSCLFTPIHAHFMPFHVQIWKYNPRNS